jgi:nicotinamidase-related amidase
MKKKPLQQKAAHLSAQRRNDPEWVASMHDHYQRTGAFRAQDLDRVLGDPRKEVSGESQTELACALARARFDT